MTEEKKEKLQVIKHRIDLSNKFRLAFLFIGVVILVFIYFGNKIWDSNQIYISFRRIALFITGWDLIFMVISTFTKLIFTIQYNKTIKQI